MPPCRCFNTYHNTANEDYVKYVATSSNASKNRYLSVNVTAQHHIAVWQKLLITPNAHLLLALAY